MAMSVRTHTSAASTRNNAPHQLNLVTKEFKEGAVHVQFLVECLDRNDLVIVEASIHGCKVALAQDLSRANATCETG